MREVDKGGFVPILVRVETRKQGIPTEFGRQHERIMEVDHAECGKDCQLLVGQRGERTLGRLLCGLSNDGTRGIVMAWETHCSSES